MPSASLPTSVPDMSGTAFWLESPVLLMVVLLTVVTLVALFRAPRSEATAVLRVFAAALAGLARLEPVRKALRSCRIDRRRRAGQARDVENRPGGRQGGGSDAA